MLAKLSAVTVGDIWDTLWRGFVWAIAMILVAWILELEWNWRLGALCIFSSFVANIVDRK